MCLHSNSATALSIESAYSNCINSAENGFEILFKNATIKILSLMSNMWMYVYVWLYVVEDERKQVRHQKLGCERWFSRNDRYRVEKLSFRSFSFPSTFSSFSSRLDSIVLSFFISVFIFSCSLPLFRLYFYIPFSPHFQAFVLATLGDYSLLPLPVSLA